MTTRLMVPEIGAPLTGHTRSAASGLPWRLALLMTAVVPVITFGPVALAQTPALASATASAPAEALTAVTSASASTAAPVRATPGKAPASGTGGNGTMGTASPSLLSPSWASLTAAQKDCLAPLQPEWDQLDSALKGKWLEIAARYPKLSPEHQQRLRERMVAWTRMSPSERQKARIGYQHAEDLRSEEQASRLQAKWEAYQALSPETRQRLAERAAEKASERRAGKGAAQQANGGSTSVAALAVPSPSAGMPGPLTLSSGPTVVLARPGTSTVLLTQRLQAPLPGATALGDSVRPLRSPREGHLNPQTLLPQRERGPQAEEASR